MEQEKNLNLTPASTTKPVEPEIQITWAPRDEPNCSVCGNSGGPCKFCADGREALALEIKKLKESRK